MNASQISAVIHYLKILVSAHQFHFPLEITEDYNAVQPYHNFAIERIVFSVDRITFPSYFVKGRQREKRSLRIM